MFSVGSFIFLSLVYITNCEDGYLPPYITPCDFNSEKLTDCVKEQIEITLPKFTKGIPEMDVPSTDPVHLNDIKIDGNGLVLTLSDAAMHGLSKSKITELNVEFGKREESFSLSFQSNLNLTAKYVMDGKILILPIQGNGDAVIDATGVTVKIDSKLVHVKDSLGDHLKLAKPKYSYTIESTKFQFENLFNGNKQLADTTTQFANENWKQLMDELAPPAIEQIVRTIVKAINKFLSKVTVGQIVKGYPTEAN